jgi:hypothetical protein
MRLWRRGRINDEEDEEIASRVRRLMRRAQAGHRGCEAEWGGRGDIRG